VVIVEKKLNDLESRIQVMTSDQKALLTTIAETTARNGADQITESIVRDCTTSERSRFDTLLGRLNSGLSKSELSELSRLYDRCGTFYAERKSVMVARLSREIEVYESYVQQLKTVSDKKTVASYSVERWKELAEAEKRQSNAFTNLAQLQGTIISLLNDGKSPTSKEVNDTLTKVKEQQQILAVANTEASEIRKSLLNF